jgi:2,4-diaminopentanoate dehydrogenase
VQAVAEKTYRVIQWATGVVGRAALKHFIENPAIELAGVCVTSPEKVGKDAGALVGLPPTGVIAIDDAEALIALDADCVFFAGLVKDLDLFCRLLRSGKNVVSPAGPFFPTARYKAEFDRLEAACREGGTSFHGCGIHPGFSGDLLPLTLTRLMNRVDLIEVTEVIDKLRNPMIYTEIMGFGRDPDELLANPSRSAEAPFAFEGSMRMVVEGLGKTIEKLTTRLEVATATQDIPYALGLGLPATGLIKQGTVAGQHFEWTAWADGKPLVVYHFYWVMGEHVEPQWLTHESCYKVVIHGDPPLEVRLMGAEGSDGQRPFLGLPWTGLVGATAVPAVCEAAPGVVTHLDLGVVQPRGLVRP